MFDSYAVIGGLGRVGSAVVRALLRETETKIVVFDRDSTGNVNFTSSLRVSVVIGDARNSDLLLKVFQENSIECVVDCATRGRDKCLISTARNAIEGITRQLDTIREYGKLKSFVLVSSKQMENEACEERAALFGAEAMLHSYIVSYRLPLEVARASGPEDASAVVAALIGDKAGARLPAVADDEPIASTTRNGVYNKILLYSASEWLSSQFVEEMKSKSVDYVVAKAKPGYDSDEAVRAELVSVAPSNVVYIAKADTEDDYTGCDVKSLRPNMNDNLYAPWLLASLCSQMHIHFSFLGSASIFELDEQQTSFKENDTGNFHGTPYSTVHNHTDKLLRNFDNVLHCRIQSPVNARLEKENFIVKLTTSQQVPNVTTSLTILPDCLPVALDLCLKRHEGIVNLINPGSASLAEVAKLCKENINKEWDYQVVETNNNEDVKVQSPCVLDTTKLSTLYPHVPTAERTLLSLVQSMKISNQ